MRAPQPFASILVATTLVTACPKVEQNASAQVDEFSSTQEVYEGVIQDHCMAFAKAIHAIEMAETALRLPVIRDANGSLFIQLGRNPLHALRIEQDVDVASDRPVVSIQADLPIRTSGVHVSRFFAVLSPGEVYPDVKVVFDMGSRGDPQRTNIDIDATLDGSLEFFGTADLLYAKDNPPIAWPNTDLNLNDCDRGLKVEYHNAAGSLFVTALDALKSGQI